MLKNTYFLLILGCLSSIFLSLRPKTIPNAPFTTMTTIDKTTFGKLADGQIVDQYTLRNKNGMTAKIINYGCIITHLTAPNKNGVFEDVVLGFDNLEQYVKSNPFFGAIVGRFGNRIGKGKFTLDGKTYSLFINNGPNALHGGKVGFDKVVWKTEILAEQNALKMSYLSKDGEEGYPGNLTTEVIYRLTDNNALEIEYKATTDKATVINLCNHTYFNLTTGKRDILNHEIALNADKIVAVDKTLIPTGVLRPVVGTPFDFTKSVAIGARIDDTNDEQIKFGGGYDHCFVATDQTEGKLKTIATVYEPSSGRVLEALTTEPGVQFYTGNFLNGSVTSKNGVVCKKRYGFCLETQHFPDSPNQPSFPSTVLRPGQTYQSKTVYRFSAK